MKQLIVYSLLFVACGVKASAQNTVTIEFRNKVGQQPLQLFEQTYTNNFQEPFVVNKFRYYISHLTIGFENGTKWLEMPSYYHLVDEEDSSSKSILLKQSFSNIAILKFTLGVDSSKLMQGPQTGELDPMRGMFWTWNSGYIFAKLEGQSDSSHAPAHYFTYHIGGYKHIENAIRNVQLVIPKSSNNIHKIVIDVDVLKWFQASHALSITQYPICHQPGKLATQFADNYSSMFSIAEVQ
jgi:hypothetical protein